MAADESPLKEDDQILNAIGNIGKWQWIQIAIVCVSGFPIAWQILVISFLSPGIGYWCTPQTDAVDPLNPQHMELWQNFSSPIKEDGSRDKCNIYNVSYSSLTLDDLANLDLQTNETRQCREWTYDYTQFPRTIVSDFELVCHRDWLVTVSQMIYMLGVLFGALGSGIISDRLGRKKTLIAVSFLLLVFGIITAFSVNIGMFIVMRFFVALSTISIFSVGFCYCMEMIGGKWSTIIGIGLEFPWATAYSLLPAIAYAVPDWSLLQLTISVPTVVVFILFFFIPESARWLLANERVDEATKILEKAAKINGRKSNDLKLEATTHWKEEDGAGGGCCDIFRTVTVLFRTPNMRKKTLIQYFLWFTNSFVYYGLTLNSGSLIPGNLYINFLVGGLIEFPAYALTILVLLFFGRRLPLSAMMLLAGIALLLTLAMPEGNAVLAMASLGKFGITCSFAVIYVYAAELFPTVVRNTGLGSSSMFARLGSIIAPLIGRELTKTAGKAAAIVIFGIFSIAAGLLTLLLPETMNKKLPDSLQEGEDFGADDDLALELMRRLKSKPQAMTSPGVDNKAFD